MQTPSLHPRSLEKVQLTQDDDSHSVEDGPDVSQQPQKQCEFEWVDEVFDEEEATQFGDVCVDVSHSDAGDVLNLLGLQSQVNVQDFPENMTR